MATPGTIGSEFQVNTYVTDDQRSSSTAALKNGEFVIIWQSDGQDSSNDGVFGQRYDVNGTAIGAEFQVNTYTTNYQSSATITALSDGGFVVAWNSFLQDSSGTGIYGQRYNANGTVNGAEFQVNTYTSTHQSNPTLTSLEDGGFAIVWSSLGQDGAGGGIYAQRYHANGTVNGAEFQVNTEVADHQSDASATGLADGGFLVTWNSNLQDGSGYGVFGQRYHANGTPNGSEFQVNTFTTFNQSSPAVTNLNDGGFVVIWNSVSQDSSLFGVFGQLYHADGTTNGVEFQVNTYTTSNQFTSAVTNLADGGFIVTWQSFSQDGSGYGIYGQRFSADGAKNGSEFPINTYTTGAQLSPAITSLANGDIVVTWESSDQDSAGTYGIYAQLFSVDLFTAGDDMVYLPAISPAGGWQALAGDDRVIGSDNADTVSGGAGDDYITAGLGNDNVDGGMGDDYITGGDGMDTIDGGDGSDYLYGQGGDDIINAGAGTMDVSLGDDGNDTINGEAGMDYMYGYAGNDTAHGGTGDDVAYGGTGNDELYGDDGADWLFGEAGNDKLFGGAGADLLMGGAGVDEITGGAGNDWLWGGVIWPGLVTA